MTPRILITLLEYIQWGGKIENIIYKDVHHILYTKDSIVNITPAKNTNDRFWITYKDSFKNTENGESIKVRVDVELNSKYKS